MKKVLRIAAVVLLFAFAITAMTACLGVSDEEFIKKALNATAELKNFEAEMSMDVELSFEDESVSAAMKMDMICFDDPFKMYMNMHMSYFGMDMDTEMYLEDKGDGNAALYTKMYDVWYSEEVDIGDFLSNQNADISGDLELYLKNTGSFKKDGEEKIKDYDTIKFTGVITGDDIKEVISSTGVADMTMGGFSDGALDEIIGNFGDLTISVWVDKKTYTPVRYTIDMTEMMQSVLESADADDGSIDKCVIDMTIFNFNEAADFEIPAEALDAEALNTEAA